MVAKPVIVGLLGGVASGKSSVAERLARLGALLIDADRLAHEVLQSPDIVLRIREEFGDGVLDGEGRPDRRRIGETVFEDREKLSRLEGILHPRVRAEILLAIESAEGVPAVVVDAPLLLEGGLAEIVDVLVFVVAPTQDRIDRARAQRNWEPEALVRREEQQMPIAEKESRARLTIRNDSTLSELDRRVDELWRRLMTEGQPGQTNRSKEID